MTFLYTSQWPVVSHDEQPGTEKYQDHITSWSLLYKKKP